MNGIIICSNTLTKLPNRFKDDSIISIFHRDRKEDGVASAKNEAISKGLKNKKIHQFAFVDCDDSINFKILNEAFYFLENSRFDFIYCPHNYLDNKENILKVKLKGNLEEDIKYLHPFSYIFKRDILEKVYNKYGMFFTEGKRHSIGLPFIERVLSVGANFDYKDYSFYTYYYKKNTNSLSVLYQKEKNYRRKKQLSPIVTI